MNKVIRAALEFATHVVCATFVLLVIAAAAIGLGEFVHYIVEDNKHLHVAGWLQSCFRLLEGFVFIADAITFVIYVVATTGSFLRTIVKEM